MKEGIMQKEPAPTTTPVTPPVAAAPVEPQVAPQVGQPAQYVITQQSLRGIGGWLAFWIVIFALIGIGCITRAFGANDSAESPTAIDTLFNIVMGAGFLATTVLLAMQKKLGLMAAYGSLALAALYSVINALVNTDDKQPGYIVGNIIGSLLVYGLIALYFKHSRRVKETLVN